MNLSFRVMLVEGAEAPDCFTPTGVHGVEPEKLVTAGKKPTCAEDAYYTGMKMTYTDGKRYECIAPEDYGVTWGPDVLPGMWREVTD
ncbi:hypothetical protein [Collinsella tanakaei]|uniref:hypothetical protein n=1 Tax=Collinsella tanakaei TaxID=626935 RepID=UPI0025A33B82|nr:hypothetical protein [Collinsella tanakaei]MDM8301398.1 hypothetical protein [Collinsella tanakaei]